MDAPWCCSWLVVVSMVSSFCSSTRPRSSACPHTAGAPTPGPQGQPVMEIDCSVARLLGRSKSAHGILEAGEHAVPRSTLAYFDHSSTHFVRMIRAKWPIRRFWCNRQRQEEHCLGCCTWREAIGRSNPHGLSSTFAVDPNCVQLPLDSSHFEAGVSFSRIAPCAGT
jgi:hypothetical protein